MYSSHSSFFNNPLPIAEEQTIPLPLSELFSENNPLEQKILDSVFNNIAEKLNDKHPTLTESEINEITKKINKILTAINLNRNIVFDCRIIRRTSIKNNSMPVYTALPNSEAEIMAEGAHGAIKLPLGEFKWDETGTFHLKKYHGCPNKLVKEMKELANLTDSSIEEKRDEIDTMFVDAHEAIEDSDINYLETVIKDLREKLDELAPYEELLDNLNSEFDYARLIAVDPAQPNKGFHVIPSLGLMFMPYHDGHTIEQIILDKKITDEYELFKLFMKIHFALIECHAQGLVHNDFRGSNIIQKLNGEIVIVDLGSTVPHGKERREKLNLVAAPPELYESAYRKDTNQIRPPADKTHDIFSLGILLAFLYQASSRIWILEEITSENQSDLPSPIAPSRSKLPPPTLAAFYRKLCKLEQQVRQLKSEKIDRDNFDDTHSEPSCSIDPNAGSDDYSDQESKTKTVVKGYSNIGLYSHNSEKNSSNNGSTTVKNAIAHLRPAYSGQSITEDKEVLTSKPNALIKITGVVLPGFLENSTLPEPIQTMIKDLCYGMLSIDPKERLSHNAINQKAEAIENALQEFRCLPNKP